MNVTGRTRIFRRDFNGRPAYSRRISAQEYNNGVKGDWMNAYENVQFPQNTDLPDKTDIEVTKAFETLYRNRNGEIVRKLVVQEYRVLELGQAQQIPTGFDEADDVPW